MPTAAILIGGEARRFQGRDKSQLLIDGRAILDRQIDVLNEIADEILLVGSRPRALSPLNVRLVHDETPGLGPLGGLAAALAEARSPELVVLACDMPFVTAPLLAHLLTRAAVADAVDAAVPRTRRGFHPLCAVYSRRCLPIVARRLRQGQLALHGLLSELRVEAVETDTLACFGDPERLLANVNTPADLDDLELLSSHKQ